VLNAYLPFSLINGTICPIHLSIAIALVIHVVSFVYIAALPREYAIPILSVTRVFTIISIAWRCCIYLFLPFTLAVLEAILKLAYIHAPALPFILSMTIWFTCSICTSEGVPIGENVSTLSIL
jgi:hypothetical protein